MLGFPRWHIGTVNRLELAASPRWSRTGNAYFPAAAQMNGQWWVLRINSFPDHPLWTLFIDGQARYDIDDMPPSWGGPLTPEGPSLNADDTREALAPVQDLTAYGSEAGAPCDNPFCCG
jgi:hypothetical protein